MGYDSLESMISKHFANSTQQKSRNPFLASHFLSHINHQTYVTLATTAEKYAKKKMRRKRCFNNNNNNNKIH